MRWKTTIRKTLVLSASRMSCTVADPKISKRGGGGVTPEKEKKNSGILVIKS
jgi:hypothetical protein